MVSRKESADRRRALVAAIREDSRTGALRPDEMLPPVRELSATYGLSAQTVSLELRRLVAEGLLYSVPRVGIFRSRGVVDAGAALLFLAPPTYSLAEVAMHTTRLQVGFEKRAAQLGMSSLQLPLNLALESHTRGTLPELAGVFDASQELDRWPDTPDVALVQYSTPSAAGDDRSDAPEVRSAVDRVYFDNEGGGRAAAEHLLHQGHRKIAFLGLHGSREPHPHYEYSVHRAHGWQKALRGAHLSPDGLAFTPELPPPGQRSEVGVAAEVAQALVKRGDITAVVGANDHAVIGLVEQLRRAEVPVAQWPAMVGFDGTLGQRGSLVTSIRLPWEEMGQAAADILFDRHSGRLTGPAVSRSIAMTLIPRMSSRADWTAGSGAAILGSIGS